MPIEDAVLEVRQLQKFYGDFRAVDGLSFAVGPGEVFGLLGPNGAGKTTAIRCIMDIFKPDGGEIAVLGQSPTEVRAQVGYLPEERGLYRNLKVLDVLVYLGQLKGVPRALAQKRARAWLERVELDEWGRRKVNDLSRGMQQKVQFVACLIHDPQLLILDEPFQGLDPVNVDLLQSLIRDLQSQGKTVVLSAHEMSMVEALCDRICLINHGKAVLYGRLDEIKRQFASRTVRVRTPALPASLPGVIRIEQTDHVYTLTLGDTSAQDVLRTLVECGTAVESFEVATAPLQEIFVSVVKEKNHA